jgi:hypothetical protein
MISNVYFAEQPYVKNHHVITFKLNAATSVQFIFRCYNSISEILHGFDIASSAIGFDGTNLFTTSIGHIAIKYGFNIIDTTRLSPSYEFRLSKYLGRGFGIIMPNFNIDKVIRTEESTRITVAKLSILVYSERRPRNPIGSSCQVVKHEYERDPSDYLDDVEDSVLNPIINGNLNAIMTGRLDKLAFTGKGGDFNFKFMDNEKETIVKQYKKFMDNIFKNRNDVVNIGRLKKLNPSIGIDKILKILTDGDEEKFNMIVNKGVLEIDIAMLTYVPQISWRTKNPGAQAMVTSSFQPTPMTAKEWYGEWYTD